MRRLLVLAPVLLVVAACGSDSGHVVGNQVTVSAGASTGQAVSPFAGVPGGNPTPQPQLGVSGAGGTRGFVLSGPAASPAQAALAAAAGRYMVHVTSTSTINGRANGPQRNEDDPFDASAPVSQNGGVAQADTVTTSDGKRFVFDLVYMADGSVLLASASQPGQPGFTPSPPVMVVPAGAAPGQSWSGSFTGPGGGGGTWNGSTGSAGTAAVGGQSVPTVSVSASGTFSGTYQGIPYTATINVTAQWAPSIHLFAGYSSTANGRAGGATPITATAMLGATLLTARPS